MADAVRDVEGVTFHDLYETYPDMLIDVRFEQEQLLAHEAVVFQHPFYWYSAPSLIKEWLDLVLTHGWAYGDKGHAVDGKLWMQAITSGGGDDSYGPSGHNRFTIGELLRPFEATAHLCRMRWREPFVMRSSHMRTPELMAECARTYRARVLGLMREE